MYNAALNVEVKPKFSKSKKSAKDGDMGSPECSDLEKATILSHLEARFDRVVNRHSKFRNDCQINTNFCNELLVAQPVLRRLDDADDPLLPMNGEEGISDANHWYDEVENEDEGDDEDIVENEDQADDGVTVHRELDLRIVEWLVDLFLRGGGTCYLCSDDDKDASHPNRRLEEEDHVALFYQKSRDMEKELNDKLTGELRRLTRRKDHCLHGMHLTVTTHLLPVENHHSQTKCTDPPSLFCCAPERNPYDVCSKEKKFFGDNPFCHNTQENCEVECRGVWVDALGPSVPKGSRKKGGNAKGGLPKGGPKGGGGRGPKGGGGGPKGGGGGGPKGGGGGPRGGGGGPKGGGGGPRGGGGGPKGGGRGPKGGGW